MTRYLVYLEIADDGRCMAHVLGLPGCIVRAPSRDEALCRLPNAIHDYHAWLCRHGEPAPPDEEPVEIEVVVRAQALAPSTRAMPLLFSLQTVSSSPPRGWSAISVSWPTLVPTCWPWCVIYLTMSWIGSPTPSPSASAACYAT